MIKMTRMTRRGMIIILITSKMKMNTKEMNQYHLSEELPNQNNNLIHKSSDLSSNKRLLGTPTLFRGSSWRQG